MILLRACHTSVYLLTQESDNLGRGKNLTRAMAKNPFSITKFWRDSVALIASQLTQGVTPQKIALSIALGLSLGIIPILGVTTILCAIAGVRLRLNQPIIQLANWLVYPLQLALLLIFVRIGEWITCAPHVSFSIPDMINQLHQSPGKILQGFGITVLHGVVAWLFIAPILTAIIYSVLIHPLKKLAAISAAIANSRNAR
jgi:uncharacterized protein (DUF2062 family)